MQQLPPIALIIFSNDLDSHLSNIEMERKVIEEALEHYDDNNRLKVITRSSVSIDELFRLFNRYSGRIALFHFAGHADGNGLQLNSDFVHNENAKADGIAALIEREVKEGLLKFVFLNGCSTMPQVEGLKAVGVPSIIATQFPINDIKALGFAKVFYHTWAKSDNQAIAFDTPLTTIQTAFDSAIAFLKTKYEVTIEKTPKGLKLKSKHLKSDTPWELFSEAIDQTLDFEEAEESKTFNEFLSRRMIEGLVHYSRPASKFLPKANHKYSDWETNTAISNKAKEIIVYSMVGVLGIQLQKLFAIGKEVWSKNKEKKYIETCLYTSKRTFKLLNFTLLSKLWDYRTLPQYANLEFTPIQQSAIEHFFKDDFELDLEGEMKLLQQLSSIYSDNQLELPFEQESFESLFEENSFLQKAVAKLQEINRVLDKSQYNLPHCFAAEKQLVAILQTFDFLAEYRMISIRDISYDEMRNQSPRYIHNYTVLGIDAKQNVNAERVKTDDAPINTDAILLYKGKRYQESINLFPFMIDLNTLTFEDKAKICFFDSKDINDGSLNYRFLKDNLSVNITFEGIGEKGEDLANIIAEQTKFKRLKLDLVFQQFFEAQKVILGDTGEEEDDFDDLFDDDDF